MFLGALFSSILSANGCFQGINYDVPNYVITQNFGLVDFIYRAIRIVAPWILLYSLDIFEFHLPSLLIGGILYLLAFGIKRLTWHLAYNI